MCPKNGSSLDLNPDPMDLMDLRLTGFGSRSNPSISYTGRGKPCSFRTIENRPRDWGFNRRNFIEDSTELRLWIVVLFQLSYSDTNIIRQLIREGQGQISERQVARIRKKIGFVHRMTVWEQTRADKQLVDLVRKEFNKKISSYDRKILF